MRYLEIIKIVHVTHRKNDAIVFNMLFSFGFNPESVKKVYRSEYIEL